MVFLTIHDDIFNSQGLALTEEMDLIYRDGLEGEVAPRPQPRPVEPVWKRTVNAEPPFLFCFSALTYNSHRIHYDCPYTTKIEGYPGLLIAGPLQALLLLDLVRQHEEGQLVEFSCRAQRPLFHGSVFSAEGAPTPDGKGATLWTCDAAGGVAMIASVTRA
jgi:3-methylfumaryl-CoA hydratase